MKKFFVFLFISLGFFPSAWALQYDAAGLRCKVKQVLDGGSRTASFGYKDSKQRDPLFAHFQKETDAKTISFKPLKDAMEVEQTVIITQKLKHVSDLSITVQVEDTDEEVIGEYQSATYKSYILDTPTSAKHYAKNMIDSFSTKTQDIHLFTTEIDARDAQYVVSCEQGYIVAP